jgi:hypothetical protein
VTGTDFTPSSISGIFQDWIMLDRVLTGGQSGAEQAAWRTAKAFGVLTGGWMPSGFLTDEGPHPEFAQEYGSAELPFGGDSAQPDQNVQESGATLWFGGTTTATAHATVWACQRLGKPFMPIYPSASFEPSHVAVWIKVNKIATLHVTGNRETEEPGIGNLVERFLGEVLRQLGYEPT